MMLETIRGAICCYQTLFLIEWQLKLYNKGKSSAVEKKKTLKLMIFDDRVDWFDFMYFSLKMVKLMLHRSENNIKKCISIVAKKMTTFKNSLGLRAATKEIN